jgi:hypothetical protein
VSVDLYPERKGRKVFYSEYYTDARFVINNLILEEDQFWLLGARCLPNQTPTLASRCVSLSLSPSCGTRKASFSSPRCDRPDSWMRWEEPGVSSSRSSCPIQSSGNFTHTNLLTFGRSEFSGVRAHGHAVRVILL